MPKYAVSYVEIYRTTYIVEAESYKEAEEKVTEAAENYELDCGIENFDHWDVEPSERFGNREVPELEAKYYTELPEPKIEETEEE